MWDGDLSDSVPLACRKGKSYPNCFSCDVALWGGSHNTRKEEKGEEDCWDGKGMMIV